MEFKGTDCKWTVKHSNTKNAFNVIGSLGYKYKIAKCNYLDEKDRVEVNANALLISKATEMLKLLQTMIDKNYLSHEGDRLASKMIKEATEI